MRRYIAGLGALNVDFMETVGSDSSDTIASDAEYAITADQAWAAVSAPDSRFEPFLGGSAFNTITMIGQLKRRNLRLGQIGVSSNLSYGPRETHRDRLRRLLIDDLTYHSSAGPGLCVAKPSPLGRTLQIAPAANLEIASHLGNPRILDCAAKADILHLTSLLEHPDAPGTSHVADAVAAFVRKVKRMNPDLIVSFDPGDPWVKMRHTDSLRSLYRHADLLLVNSEEFEELTEAGAGETGSARSMRRLCPNGTAVILKCRDRVIVRLPSDLQVVHVPRPAVTSVVDPTGAGDAISAGVLTAVAENRSLVEGCALGLRIAIARISAYGDLGHTNLPEILGDIWAESGNSG